ncbi:DUF4231 domain-containing protein [Brasilonema octagenarum]|jgi:hypothetical protein|uniref:DUF4231 domain-containing protein n=1 Tax=Brasilonema octagenarum UFV-OR1 TaxID=417115 RepID=A0ABX1MDE9_9CYAN|nr:DUF4231 domain-containing protein [Brasilonema octagenarum]NMF65800.1 DUF4231 domain-containing protein [Brasilonema octagenarum UFV-OR1]
MTTIEPKNQTDMSDMQEQSSSSSSQKMLLFTLKIIEYFFLAAFIGSGVITFVLPDNPRVVLTGSISLAIFVFLFLINQQVFRVSSNAASKLDLQRKAELYLMNSNNHSTKNPIAPAREKALQYSQELIDDYKKTRNLSRNLYYSLQIGTIVFSGVTPILVLVDKLEPGQSLLKWLPVIFPAIASIVASVVTSFPFQENWISANTTVESLEAEQEKFVLGITPSYRCYDSVDESQQQQKAKEAIENFITQVNNIHLNQLQAVTESQKKEEKTQPADQSTQSNSQQS